MNKSFIFKIEERWTKIVIFRKIENNRRSKSNSLIPTGKPVGISE